MSTERSLTHFIEIFLRARTSEGVRKSTIGQYKDNFSFFIEYLDRKSMCTNDISLITREVIRDYINWMLYEKIRFENCGVFMPDYSKTVGISPVTANLRIKTLKAFFNFLMAEEYVIKNPCSGLRKVREDQSEIRVLTAEQLRILLSAVSKSSYASYRDYVLINVLIDGFTRISETLLIKTNDIDFNQGVIVIAAGNAKGRKSRIIPLKKRTMNLLKNLLNKNEKFSSDFVFLTDNGEKMDGNRFRHRLREYVEKARLNVRVHPHLFRHTGATIYLQNGGDIRHLALILGHKDLRIVQRYTHPSEESIKKQHNAYSPLNNLFGDDEEV
ncbi:tyrosine-type recombinase/integrase [Paenibacillus contaminans]|uniref:Integrase n=1 Tax=Paenibacillus contaminans TaxID=450362 RepID=A0A329MLC0_9BACL|nr:tyrosine-type recombinase/integrase [Paenibacillus contaminans]RAV19513.1 integrase [Paenibacillus contaminans]